MYPPASLPTVADLVLRGPVLPHLTEAVLLAESCRRAALVLHSKPTPTLAGKATDGRPLRGQHQHAHYVPDCRGTDPLRITHVLVYAPGGLAPSEVAALNGIRYLPRAASAADSDERLPVDVSLCSLGSPVELGLSQLCQAGRVFSSRTPFVLPRHCKPGDQPEDQLLRELRLRGLAMPVKVERIAGPLRLSAAAQVPMPWSAFRRQRAKDRLTTGTCGFRMEFSELVRGPLLLGYGCHYGLGQFVAHGS